MVDLSALTVLPKSGLERFTHDGNLVDRSLSDFWRWSVSDLVSNATRGRLAEFIVALALGLDLSGVRDEWRAYDLILPDKTTVKVKSAAYLQSWSQRELSPIVFSIQKSLAWYRETNAQAKVAARQAKIYVFALLAHEDKRTVDPMKLNQWKFYVVPTAKLNAMRRSQKTISLKALQELADAVSFAELRKKFDLEKVSS